MTDESIIKVKKFINVKVIENNVQTNKGNFKQYFLLVEFLTKKLNVKRRKNQPHHI